MTTFFGYPMNCIDGARRSISCLDDMHHIDPRSVLCACLQGRKLASTRAPYRPSVICILMAPACCKIQQSVDFAKQSVGEWCNGSTTDSDSVCLGSNPGSPARSQTIENVSIFRRFDFISKTLLCCTNSPGAPSYPLIFNEFSLPSASPCDTSATRAKPKKAAKQTYAAINEELERRGLDRASSSHLYDRREKILRLTDEES